MKQTRFLFVLLLCISSKLGAQQAYEIHFTAGAVQHHGLLISGQGSQWQLRVRYYDRQQGCQRLIEQKMSAEKTGLGTRLRGYAVWDVLKKHRAADYAADNLYLSYDQNGKVYSKNIDAQGTAVTVKMVALDNRQQQTKKREFGWP
ncbi:MAG: hypothetical protein KDC70_14690 [Saprospiraceae bacterium]|nr:hypothetical protein [Saprospiraceae bacterium]